MANYKGLYYTVNNMQLKVNYIFSFILVGSIIAFIQLYLMFKFGSIILTMLLSYVIVYIFFKIFSIFYNKSEKRKLINQDIL